MARRRRIEGLQTTFHVDEPALVLGPRRDRQQHGGVLRCATLEGRQHHHTFGRRQGLHGRCAIGAIELRLQAEQHIALTLRCKNIPRLGVDQGRPNAVGADRQETQGRAAGRGNGGGLGVQGIRLRMGLRYGTQQDSLVCSRLETRGDGLSLGRGRSAIQRLFNFAQQRQPL